jgi:hypothetical protein
LGSQVAPPSRLTVPKTWVVLLAAPEFRVSYQVTATLPVL